MSCPLESESTEEWMVDLKLVTDTWSLDLENFSFSFYCVCWCKRGGTMQFQDNASSSFAQTVKVN